MRALSVTWRTIVSLYNELFLFIGLCLLWWLTGGFMVAAMVIFGLPFLQVGGPVWLVPLVAIPAGPATAALANAARRAARDIHVDRSFFWDGWKQYWKRALALNAISMVIFSLLILNLFFYLGRAGLVQALAFLWAYLLVFWFSVQLYLFPVLIGLKEPTVLGALRTAVVFGLAKPPI
jgi:uncharacterized membrane protein YesL